MAEKAAAGPSESQEPEAASRWSLEPSCVVFLGTLAGTRIGSGELGCKSTLIWDDSTAGSSLTYTVLVLQNIVLNTFIYLIKQSYREIREMEEDLPFMHFPFHSPHGLTVSQVRGLNSTWETM